MSRGQIYAEIEQLFGLVPSFFKHMPDDSLELEWNLFKKVEVEGGPIQGKYRELMGVAIATATHCPYCAYFHTRMAKLQGATDEEIQDAVQYTKNSVGVSSYLHGIQVNLTEFKQEIDQACEFVLRQR